jgi:serine/threonine protein phosphatase PrpC
MNFKIDYITNMGLKRFHNEDAILINDILICNKSMNDSKSIILQNKKNLLCCVSDGMGGHQKGEVASCFILKELKENTKNIKDENSFKEIFLKIKNKMDNLIKENSEYLNMGSVLAGIYITEPNTYIFNVGDSRVYAVNHGYLEQLSQDHSLVFNLYENGKITYEDMAKHPKKNIVTSAFIANPYKNISQIFIKKIPSYKYNQFFICSDGIWELLNIDKIEEYLKQNNPLKLIKENVLKNGAYDNFSAIYIKGLE